MKGFKSTSTNPYTYTQTGVWKAGQYTFQAVVLSDSGYAFAFQRSDTTWQTVDLSWQVKDGSYSKIQWTFALEVDAVAFKLIANTVTGETTVLQPMLEKGTNGSTPIAHEEDLRGMDGDNHEFIFTRNDTGIAPDAPLSTQDDDYVPEYWTDNAQGVTSEIPFEFVSMRERKNGVWLDFSPPSLWAKWGEDGLSVNLLVEGHYKSHWEGITKVVEIVGGVDVGGDEVVKVSAVFRKGEENIAATVSQSRGFQWYVNGVHLTSFDNQPFITLDETYGDGFADYVVLSYLVNSIREEERREIINISEGMDGIGEEFIFKANNSETEPPVLPQTTDTNYQDDDYYGQGTANEWNDDPVAPTELNQFVWVAKRKKIGGIWEAFGTPSVWTKWVTDGEDGKDAVAPIIINGHWAFWDETIQDYVESAFSAIGDDGHSPYVDENTGTWWEWNDATGAYQDTGVTAKGDDGLDAPLLYLSASAQVMKCNPDNTPQTGQTISIQAKLQNVSGTASFDATPYNDAGTALSKITLGGSGNDRTLTNAKWLATYKRIKVVATLGSLSDTVTITRLSDGDPGDPGEDGEDGITISPNQQGYTYRADLNGDIIGSLANGMVELTIMSGSTPITCSSSLSGGVPTTNGTYRVTRTLGNGITTNSSLSGGKYRITPATLTVDEASVELVIKIMMGGVVTSYPLTLTYRKQFDGADGKSTEFIFKGHTSDNTAPTLPSTSQQDDWYGQGTANEWNDDLVEPTKSLPYVWASQRKKVNGLWGAFTTPKVWLRYAEDGEDGEDGDPAKSIHLNPSAKAISITKGNIPVPTSVTVAGTAVNTTIQYWYYSADGATSFTSTAPTGVTRSGNQVTINSATAKFKTLSIKARNSSDDVEDVVTITRGGGAPYVDETTRTWWTWDEELGVYTDTGMSPVGSDGRIPYPAGYWEAKTYTRDANYAPYVQHTTAVYLLVEDSALSTDVPGTSNKWKSFNTWTAVFVDSLVAAFAKIGGAVFTGDTSQTSSAIKGRLISETGVKSGAANTNFNEYVGDSGAWIPNMMLDFLSGAAYFGGKKSMLNADGSGQLASGNMWWTEEGDITVWGKILTGLTGTKRIEIDPDTHTIKMYTDVNNNVVLEIGGLLTGGATSNAYIRMYDYAYSTLNKTLEISPAQIRIYYPSGRSITLSNNKIEIRNDDGSTSFSAEMTIRDGVNEKLYLRARGLPTSSSGLFSGEMYRDGNTIKIV